MSKTEFIKNIKSGLSSFGKSVNDFKKSKVQPFFNDVRGRDVKVLDGKIKDLTHSANEIGHDAYTKASKQWRGWDITPRHENYRMKKVFENPEYSSRMDKMIRLQEERKALSQKRNRARVKLGAGIAIPSAAIGGGIAAKYYLDKKKREKEDEEMYYKTASFKDSLKSVKDTARSAGITAAHLAKATGSQIKRNFAHAPEVDYIYGAGKKERLKDIATFARVKELSNILQYGNSGVYTEIPDDSFGKLNRHIRSFNNADAESKRLTAAINAQKAKIGHRTDLDMLVGKSRSAFSDSGERTNPKNNRPVGYDRKTTKNGTVYDRNAINKNIRQMENAKQSFKNDADDVLKYIDNRFGDIRKTRNNELAKSISLYAVPAVALTLGGMYIHKQHKKKKEKAIKQKESKN